MTSPLGPIIIESEGDFISKIDFTDTSKEPCISSELHQLCISQINEYFEGKRKTFDFPYKQQGTEFQQRVWNELIKIPFGVAISYIQLSRQLGDEKAVRAVGGANGKNKLAIVVPCHRVIGNNNALTGYAGGLHRKKWLLEHERNLSPVKDGLLF